MRWVIAALVTLALGAVLAPQPSADTAPVAAVDEPTLIIDVRTAEEFAAGHFPGAINIPHEDIIQGIKESNVGKDQTVLLYCRSGNRSGQAEAACSRRVFPGQKMLAASMRCWPPPAERQPYPATEPHNRISLRNGRAQRFLSPSRREIDGSQSAGFAKLENCASASSGNRS